MAKSMVEIVIDAKDQFSTVMGKANSRMKDISGSARKAGLVLGAMGGAGIIAGKNFIDAALEQQKALNTLGVAVANSGQNFDDVRGKIEQTTAALQSKTNFGDEEQMRALALMTPMLGSVEKAMEALPAVMDAATVKQVSLSTVAGTLSRALSGQVNTAITLGMSFDKNAEFGERLEQVLGAVGGAAEADADPFIQLGNAVGDLKEKIGAALIPVVMPLIGHLQSFAERIQTLNPNIIKIVAIVGLAVTAFAALVAPFLLLIGFLPAMVAGFGMLVGAVTGLMAVFGILISWPALIVLAFGALAVALIRNWGGVREKVGDAINGILKVFENMINKAIVGLNELINFANKIPGVAIPSIGEVEISLQRIKNTAGDVFFVATEKIKNFAGKAKDLMKGLPAQVVPSIDKIIGKFNDLTGENLPAMSKIIDKVKGKMTGLTEAVAGTGASAAPAQRAKEEAVVAGEAAEKSWDKAKTAHELYQQALSRKKASTTNIQMSQHELALRQMAIYNRRVADERAGTAEAGAVYGGTGERIEGGWSTVMDRLTGGRSSDPFASLPITLHIGSEEVQGSLENLLGKAAERLEASGGA